MAGSNSPAPGVITHSIFMWTQDKVVSGVRDISRTCEQAQRNYSRTDKAKKKMPLARSIDFSTRLSQNMYMTDNQKNCYLNVIKLRYFPNESEPY